MDWTQQKQDLEKKLIDFDANFSYFTETEQSLIASLRDQLNSKKENEDLSSIQSQVDILTAKYERLKNIFSHSFYFISANTVANLGEAFRKVLNTSASMTIEEMATRLVENGEYYRNQLDDYIGGLLSGPINVKTSAVRPYAFYGFDKITEFTAPSATSIGEGAFRNCTALTKFSAPIATTCESSFDHPMPFTEFTAGFTINEWKSTSTSAQPTFTENTTIKKVSLPGVTNIGAKAFYKCTNLIAAHFTSSMGGAIKDNSFAECAKLISFTAPSFSGTVGTTAFKGCKALSHIELPAITNVGNGAFSNCTGLKVVKFPNCGTISTNAFTGNTTIEEINLGTPKTTTIFSNKTALKKVTMSRATIAEANAFLKCTSLNSVSFPELTNIYTSAFAGCTSLTSIESPKVTNVSAQGFDGCENLSYVNFRSLATIGKKAFANCKNLTWDLFIAPKITTFADNAFDGCGDAFGYVDAPECTTIGQTPFTGCNISYAHFGKVTKITSAMFNDTPISSLELPNCTTLDSSALFGRGLSHISLPKCTKISTKALGENNITEITLPAITTIEAQAFEGCAKLSKVTILTSAVVTLKNSNAFANTHENLVFYVPDALVTNYQNAAEWSKFGVGKFAGVKMLTNPLTIYDSAIVGDAPCFTSSMKENTNSLKEMSIGSKIESENEQLKFDPYTKGFYLRIPFFKGSVTTYGNRGYYSIVDNNKLTGNYYSYNTDTKQYEKGTMDKYLYYADDPEKWNKPIADWVKVSDFTAETVAGTEEDNLMTNRHYWFGNEICTLTYKYVIENSEEEITEIKDATSELVPAYTYKIYSITNAPAIEGYSVQSVNKKDSLEFRVTKSDTVIYYYKAM